MTDTKTTQGKQLPVWNKYAFVCPNCQRNFGPNMIRLKRHNGTWYCHGCVIQLQGQRPAGTKITPTDEQRATLCGTCKRPLGKRRIVVNTHGHLVHYRCPAK